MSRSTEEIEAIVDRSLGGRRRGGGSDNRLIWWLLAALLGTNGAQGLGLTLPAIGAKDKAQSAAQACYDRVDKVRAEESARAERGWQRYAEHMCKVHRMCQ